MNEISIVMERALAIQNNLPPNSTSFVKNMLRSHVSGSFWLGLPKQFCVDHLPMRDEMIVLVDEDEIEYDAKYLQDKTGISAGWRSFSIAHKLAKGDVLVFELIEPCKFKVHIVRASESNSSLMVEDNFEAEPIVMVMESKRNELNVEEEMRVLKMKVNGVRVSTEKRVGEICYGLKEKHEKLSVVFSGFAGAPWALGEAK